MRCSVCGQEIDGEPSIQAHAEDQGGRVRLDMRACEEPFCATIVADATGRLVDGGARIETRLA